MIEKASIDEVYMDITAMVDKELMVCCSSLKEYVTHDLGGVNA